MTRYIYKNAEYVASNLVKRYCSFVKHGEDNNYAGAGILAGAGIGGLLGYALNPNKESRMLSALLSATAGGVAGYGLGKGIIRKSKDTTEKEPPKPAPSKPPVPSTPTKSTSPATTKPTAPPTGKPPATTTGKSPATTKAPAKATGKPPATKLTPVPVKNTHKNTHMIPPPLKPVKPVTVTLIDPKTGQQVESVIDVPTVSVYNKLSEEILLHPDKYLVYERDSAGRPIVNLNFGNLYGVVSPEKAAWAIQNGYSNRRYRDYLDSYIQDNPELITTFPVSKDENGWDNFEDEETRYLGALLHLYGNVYPKGPYSRFGNVANYTTDDLQFLAANRFHLIPAFIGSKGYTIPPKIDYTFREMARRK